MILLKSNPELKLTFEKLIKTMGVSVEWTGLFAVVGDYLILQGKVRSLFFNFENKKVITNLLEIPVKEEEVIDITDATKVHNVINIVLYAFGKWGTIPGLKVEKNYAQLTGLFTGVFREFYIEPEYTNENLRFYKESIRINYEDVVQLAIEAGEKLPEEPEEERESKQGLWHKLIWKKRQAIFAQVETTFDERQKERIGKNFYMVGYQCPDCKRNLHMVVFPVDREFRIETDEGAVILSRAYNCNHCNCFFTPRPQKLLAENDVYQMPFFDDKKAYEDYMELLGDEGERTSNYKFNEFEADARKEKENDNKSITSLEELFKKVDTLPQKEFEKMRQKMEEGFYPPESVARYEKSIKHHGKKRQAKKEKEQREQEIKERMQNQIQEKMPSSSSTKEEQRELSMPESNIEPLKTSKSQKAKGFFDTKLKLLDRLSESQCKEIKQKLKQDKTLTDEEKQNYFLQIEKSENEKKKNRLMQKAEKCQDKGYAQIKKCVEEIQGEDLPREIKEPLLKGLLKQKKEQGEKEVFHLLSHMSPHMDLATFKEFEQRLKGYEEIDPSSYEDQIKKGRTFAEGQEITNLVKRARKNNRNDYHELLNRLQQGGFSKENAEPYIEKVKGKIRQMDEEAIASICENSNQMSFAEGMEAYHKIEEGLFLPELKTNALELLGKRLARIKTEECELLIKKLKSTLAGKIKDNERFHFYPARDVLMGEARGADLEVIDSALTAYGNQREPFEYPILIVDTSKNQSGREGMILTPEHLFYSTFLNAYDIPITSIAKFKASTGLLNKGITAELKNGNKIKLPYAVETGELTTWSSVLKEFVQYLQDKPDSRNVTYLAKEKHETICCFRCGYVYKEGNVCPKCGYKSNK